MAMKNYGVESKCLCLTLKEFKDLIFANKDNIKDFNIYIGENINNVDEIEDSNICDFIYNINYGCYFGEINGSFTIVNNEDTDNLENNKKYFDNEDIVIIELERDTLFECYEDYDDIYNELIQDLLNVGIKVDKQYIKEHFGILGGSYYA